MGCCLLGTDRNLHAHPGAAVVLVKYAQHAAANLIAVDDAVVAVISAAPIKLIERCGLSAQDAVGGAVNDHAIIVHDDIQHKQLAHGGPA